MRLGNSKMKISEKGVSLIQHFEGCELKSYRCAGNVITIGWGHTKTAEENQIITQEVADFLLLDDILVFEDDVQRLVNVDLTQNQYDALVCWTFNLGATNLNSSTLLKVLNSGTYDKVSEQILRWDKSGGKPLAGLTRRRRSEALLFDTGILDFGETYV